MEIKQITYPSPEEDYNKPFFTIKNEKLEIYWF